MTQHMEAGMEIEISQDDLGTLCICALRYCQGRRTYMPGLIQDIVKAHIEELSDRDIRTMMEDCRRQEEDPSLYGSETIDKPGWLKWRDAVIEELMRRADAGTMKSCDKCRYHDDFTGACCCGDSEQRGDFTDNDFSCPEWTKREKEMRREC